MDKTIQTLTKIRDNYHARGEMVASRAIDYALDRLRAKPRVRKPPAVKKIVDTVVYVPRTVWVGMPRGPMSKKFIPKKGVS